VSLGVMAVANAFVMLGLLPEPLAEAILAEHRSALERPGFGGGWRVTTGELTVRPGLELVTACLQSTFDLSESLTHRAMKGSIHRSQAVSVDFRCGQCWWSDSWLRSKNTVK
jgi:hypothetical protein